MMVIALGFFGLLVGFSSGFFGIGGGTLLVPALIYFGYDIKMAIGISVMQMIFSSMFGSYHNYKAGVLQLHSGIYLGFGAGLSVFMFAGFIKSIPLEIEEAAMIDGCNPI